MSLTGNWIRRVLIELGNCIVWFLQEIRSVKIWILIFTFKMWDLSIGRQYGVEVISGVMAVIIPFYFAYRNKDKNRDTNTLTNEKPNA